MWLQVAIFLGLGLFVLTDDSVRKYPWLRWLGFGFVWYSLLITVLSLAGHIKDWETGKLDSLVFRILAVVTASIALGGAFQSLAARTSESSAQGVVLSSIGVTGLFVLVEAYIPAGVVGGISILLLWLCSDKLSISMQQLRKERHDQLDVERFSDRVLQPLQFGDVYERLASCLVAMVLLFWSLNVLHFAISVESHRETRNNNISTLPTQRTIDYVIRDNPSGNNPTLTANPIGDSFLYYSVEFAFLVATLFVGIVCAVSKRQNSSIEPSIPLIKDTQ